MKTYIHVGQHKTGSTSIQHFLQEHRLSLLREGLYVPRKLADSSNQSHYLLNIYALAPNRFSPKKESLFKEENTEFFEKLEHRLQKNIEKHYLNAAKHGCQEVIWSNEGLYLLNSESEYKKLYSLFASHSTEIVAICCFREKNSYANSYKNQLLKQKIPFCSDRDSYRYVDEDSWLFDYERKKALLNGCFDRTIFFDYDPDDVVKAFMDVIGHTSANTSAYRLNVSKPLHKNQNPQT